MSLIYSILGSHNNAIKNNGHTTVRIYNQKIKDQIIISISTRTKTEVNSNILEIIDNIDVAMLAVKLDVSINHSLKTDPHPEFHPK